MKSDAGKDTSKLKKAADKPVAKKRGKRSPKFLVYIIVTVIVLLVALAIPYFMWYQNPEKAVSDGVLNALSAKSFSADGTINSKTATHEFTISLSGASNKEIGKVNVKFAMRDIKTNETVKTTVDGILADNGDLYIKAGNTEDVMKAVIESAITALKEKPGMAEPTPAAIEGYRNMVTKIYEPVAKQVDNKWIKIPAETINPFNDTLSKAQACLSEVRELAANDSDAQKEVVSAYKENKFLIVGDSVGTEGSSVGYEIKIDQKAADAFAKSFEDTKIGKELATCSDDGSVLDDTATSKSEDSKYEDPTVVLWVNRWNHEISRIVSTSKDGKSTLDLKTDFNTNVSVDIPEKSKTLQEVMDAIVGNSLPVRPMPQPAPQQSPIPTM